MNPTSNQRLVRSLRWSPQLLLSGGGCLYVLGLLVVNISLARHGGASLDLFRSRYIMAGGLFAFLVLVFSFAAYAIALSVKTSRYFWGRAERLASILVAGYGVVLGLIVPHNIVVLASDGRLGRYDWETARAYGALWFTVLGLYVFWVMLATVASDWPLFPPGPFETFREVFLRVNLLILIVPLFAAGLYYSWNVFPYLAPQVGGGAPRMAEMVVTKDGLDALENVMRTPLESTEPVGPVGILDETGTDLLVSLEPSTRHGNRGTIIRIRREHVITVVLLE